MNELPDRAAIEDAAHVVHAAMSPTAAARVAATR